MDNSTWIPKNYFFLFFYIYTRIKEERKIEDQTILSPRNGYKTLDLNLNIKNFKQYSSSWRGRKKEKKKIKTKESKNLSQSLSSPPNNVAPIPVDKGPRLKGPESENSPAGFASLTGTRALNRRPRSRGLHQSIAFSLPKTITGKPNAFSPRKQIKGAPVVVIKQRDVIKLPDSGTLNHRGHAYTRRAYVQRNRSRHSPLDRAATDLSTSL